MMAENHYRHGLELYLELCKDKNMRQTDPITVCSQKSDGELFMANYRKKNLSVYSVQDLSGKSEEMDIMFCPIQIPFGSKTSSTTE
jgi:type VI protein secretion system component VasA